jgi:hypothetical protein
MINLIIAIGIYLALEAGAATCEHAGSLCVIGYKVNRVV